MTVHDPVAATAESSTAEPIPADALVSVWKDAVLLAETSQAFVTAKPERNGQLLVPQRDVKMALLAPAPGAPAEEGRLALGGEGPAVAWRDPRDVGGEPLIGFDPAQVRIQMEDRQNGADAATSSVNRFPRWGDMNDLLRLLDLAPAGENSFEAPTYNDLHRNVVEGSQLLAQAIVAAAKAVPDKQVASAHMIFSRPAVFHRPLTFDVALPRSGRTFSTVSVETGQDGKSIGSALLLMDKGAGDLIRGQVPMPDVPGPEASERYDFGVVGRECRFVNGDYSHDPERIGPPQLHAWVRHREAPRELYLRQAMLAQFTGHMTIAAAMLPHQGFSEAMAHVTISTGVLSITIALHEDPDITQWLLYANPAIYAGRGMAQGEGRVFSQDGRLVASYTVQAMIRAFDRDPKAYGLAYDRLM
jgi:acyl-CoA thioesterase-2